MRISLTDEDQGLDISEHGMWAMESDFGLPGSSEEGGTGGVRTEENFCQSSKMPPDSITRSVSGTILTLPPVPASEETNPLYTQVGHG
jgi:hypothetical protein